MNRPAQTAGPHLPQHRSCPILVGTCMSHVCIACVAARARAFTCRRHDETCVEQNKHHQMASSRRSAAPPLTQPWGCACRCTRGICITPSANKRLLGLFGFVIIHSCNNATKDGDNDALHSPTAQQHLGGNVRAARGGCKINNLQQAATRLLLPTRKCWPHISIIA